jgi:chromosome segregation ATPase
MVTCELCGKQVKTAQALRGHKTFIHGITGSNAQQPVARLATEQEVSILEDRLQKLERVTGLRESKPAGSLLDLLSDTELPLTDKLTNITEQVTKLGDTVSNLSNTVSKLSEDVELARVSKAMVDADKEYYDNRLEALNQKFKEAQNKLVAVVNSNGEQLKKAIDAFNGKFAAAERNFLETNKRLDKIEAQLVKDQNAFKSNEQSVNSLKADIVDMRQRALRRPTDDVITLTLTDGRDHRFKEYKSPQGLRQPHKTSTDLILGNRWVDLSEPED